MLNELRVTNLGIIDEVQLMVGMGLTAITGETGAGKTLLVEALELLTGGRADPALVRAGCDEARVEGRFVVAAPAPGAADEIVLARAVPASGRSRAYIDGRLATASELADVARTLVDLHGQHDQQSLLAPADQRALLDAFAGEAARDARADLRSARAEVAACDAQLALLGGDERSRAREADLLQFQIDEISSAQIVDASEDQVLATDEAILGDAEAHRAALASSYEHLENAALDAIGAAVSELAGREPFTVIEHRLRALQAEASDVAHELRLARDGVVADPERLAGLRQRRQLLREIRRKYGETLDEVLSYHQEIQQRATDLAQHATRVAELAELRSSAEQRALHSAARLHLARAEAAPRLAAAVTTELQALALPHARFEVTMEPAPLGEEGSDSVVFQLAPNPGEPLRPLARAASGGELSRTMLAIRVVLSEAPPTLVFDEVDAGIGGETANAVGRALARLGAHHQVLCVTHLAQVAAAADAQVHVSKVAQRGRTVAKAELLLDDARVNELSRMIGGEVATEAAREHARELLAHARTNRAAPRRTKNRAAR